MITFKLNDMDKFKTVFTLLVALFICNGFYVQAQDEITLMVSADGMTKGEATKSALRSAIEQAYGTFVSSNTSILNDELIKDEIVTISTGNIKSYKEISNCVSPNGNSFVTLQVTVCPSKLISYAQSKGAEVEFAGATFAMNLKMKELNKRNEEIAIKNMLYEMDKLYSEGLDYAIATGEPKADGKLEAIVEVIPNEYGVKAWELFYLTLNQLSLTDEEQKEYEKANIPIYVLEDCKPANPLNRSKVGHLKERLLFRSLETLKSLQKFFSYSYIQRILSFIIRTDEEQSLINITASTAYADNGSTYISGNYIQYGGEEYVKEDLLRQSARLFVNKDVGKEVFSMMLNSWFHNRSFTFFREYIAEKAKLNYITKINEIEDVPSCFFDEGRRYNPSNIHKKGALYWILVSYPTHKKGKVLHDVHIELQIPVEDLMKITKIEIQPRR